MIQILTLLLLAERPWVPHLTSLGLSLLFEKQEKSVLKYRFYYTGMGKPTDQETTAIGKTACYAQLPSEGGSHATTGPTGKHKGRSGGRGRGNTGKSLCCCFSGKERARQGKQISDWLVGIISNPAGSLAQGLSDTWLWGDSGKWGD